MIILRNPQIAKLIEAGCTFKSNVITSKNETIYVLLDIVFFLCNETTVNLY